MIEIHLYGNLRSIVSGSQANEDTVLTVEYIENETFAQLAARLDLKSSDLGDCFINGNLVKTGHVMADGDRVGLFPFNMVLLCGGQHLKGHGYTREDIDVDHY
jgi:molybdopterin converting factor small subunit